MKAVAANLQYQYVTRKDPVTAMKYIHNTLIALLTRLAKDERGQDLIEYALLAASVAVAVGATFPTTIAPAISGIFSKVLSSFNTSLTFGS